MADGAPAQHDEAGGDREILMLAAELQVLRAKTSSIRTAIDPLEVAFAAIRKANGYKKAEEWGHQSEYWALNDELSDLCLSETNRVDSMIKLQPKTPSNESITVSPEMLPFHRRATAANQKRSFPVGGGRLTAVAQ